VRERQRMSVRETQKMSMSEREMGVQCSEWYYYLRTGVREKLYNIIILYVAGRWMRDRVPVAGGGNAVND